MERERSFHFMRAAWSAKLLGTEVLHTVPATRKETLVNRPPTQTHSWLKLTSLHPWETFPLLPHSMDPTWHLVPKHPPTWPSTVAPQEQGSARSSLQQERQGIMGPVVRHLL